MFSVLSALLPAELPHRCLVTNATSHNSGTMAAWVMSCSGLAANSSCARCDAAPHSSTGQLQPWQASLVGSAVSVADKLVDAVEVVIMCVWQHLTCNMLVGMRHSRCPPARPPAPQCTTLSVCRGLFIGLMPGAQQVMP